VRAIRAAFLLALASLTVCVVTVVEARSSDAAGNEAFDEYKVKAAFLFNFVRFVDWPAPAFDHPAAPIVLGIVGQDPFGDGIDRLVDGKTVNGRPLMVRRIRGAADVAGCHVLFVSGTDRVGATKVLTAVHRAPVLTIGEAEGFADAGGIINFTREGRYVRFEINVNAASRAGLTLSSKLLRLARIVRDNHGSSQ
jgi:hypothetical protein